MTSGLAATAKSWRRALRLIEEGAVGLAALISSVEPLSAWEQVFADLARSDRLKIVFDPRLEADASSRKAAGKRAQA